MNKWTKAAKALKERLDAREEKATDMERLLVKIAALPPGQVKKLMDEETLDIFRKHGVDIQ